MCRCGGTDSTQCRSEDIDEVQSEVLVVYLGMDQSGNCVSAQYK